MKCFNCQTHITKPICTHCKKNLVVEIKLMNSSISLYNEGLQKCKENNLTDSVNLLSQALEIDSHLMVARNLLGLIHYERGEIGDALKHWVISASLDKKDNPALFYVEMVEKETRKIGKMDGGVVLYNEALDFLLRDSADLAIIRLRKALDLNPNLIQAMNLLTLSYMEVGRLDDAYVLANQALFHDSGNTQAILYLQTMEKKGAKHQKSKPRMRPMATGPVSPYMGRPKTLYVKEVIFFLMGAILSMGILYYMVIPDVMKEKDKEISTLQATLEKNISEEEKNYLVIQKELADKESEIEALQINIATLTEEIEQKNKEGDLLIAQQHMEAGEYKRAVDIVEALVFNDLSFAGKEMVGIILETSLPILEKEYYQLGIAAYNKAGYEEASENFLLAIGYEAAETIYGDDAYYFLGRIAERAGNGGEAKKYFDIVITKYPDSNQIAQATKRIRNYE